MQRYNNNFTSLCSTLHFYTISRPNSLIFRQNFFEKSSNGKSWDKSLCLFGYEDDEELYDTIAVDTCVIEEIEAEDYPTASSIDKSGIAASRDYLYRGSAPSLEGRICIVQFFLNTPGDGWTEKERQTATSRVYEAENWLKDKASEYGTDVSPL